MEKEIVVVALFTIFLIAAILPRIIQKQKKVETVGCIGINRKLFFLGKLSLFTSFALILVRLFSGRLSLFEKNDIFFWACAALMAVGVAFFTLAIMRLGTFSLRGTRSGRNHSPHDRRLPLQPQPHAPWTLLHRVGFCSLCPVSHQLDTGHHSAHRSSQDHPCRGGISAKQVRRTMDSLSQECSSLPVSRSRTYLLPDFCSVLLTKPNRKAFGKIVSKQGSNTT